jgi:hypothetical protein
MIAVAILGLATGGMIETIRLRKMARMYAAKAAAHERESRGYRLDAARAQAKMQWLIARTRPAIMSALSPAARDYKYGETMAKYETELARKYREAARRPWRSAAHDPPQPDFTPNSSNANIAPIVIELCKGMTELDLSQTGATDADLALIASWTQLERLVLADTLVTDEGLAHLQHLTNLRSLNLNWTHVTDRGLEHLKALNRLEQLDLFRSRVTKRGAFDIAGALPKTNVAY